MIKKETFQRFQEARQCGSILHDADIQRMMIEAARKIGRSEFKVN